MSIPEAYRTATGARLVLLWHWLEIEGLPYAYGNFAAGAGLFAGRSSPLLGVKPWSTQVPAGFDQKVEPLEGRASIGQLRYELLDRDGTLVSDLGLAVGRRDNLLTPTTEIAAEATSFAVAQTPDPTAYPTTGGVVYVGRETILYASRIGSTFSGLTRGAYGSKAQAHGTGSPISHYPRFLGGRNAVVRYYLGDSEPSNSTHDAASIARMSGVVAGCVQSRGATCFELTIDSVDRKISGWLGVDRKRMIFDGGLQGTLGWGMPDAFGVFEPEGDDDVVSPVPGELALSNGLSDVTRGGTLAGWNHAQGRGAAFFVRVDDELLLIKPRFSHNSGRFFDVLARGLWGTPVQQHHTGAEVREVMPIAWDDAKADDPVLKYLPWTSDHPIDIALQIITSTGAGTNGPYDTLPARWGMGVPVTYLDLEEIERVRDREIPWLRVAGVVTEPVDLREWLAREIYQVFGLFAVSKLNGVYSIRRLAPPMPLDEPAELSHREMVTAPQWDSNLANVVGQVIYRFDHDPLAGEHRDAHQTVFQEAQALYNGVFGTVERESSLLRSGAAGRVPSFPHLPGGAHAWAADQTGWWQAWWERPPPVIDVRCTWEQHLLEPGDLVSLSSSVLPDTEAGSLGINWKTCVVIGKKPNDAQGFVDLQLLQMGLHSSGLRHIAPSARVVSWDEKEQTLIVEADAFAAPGMTDTQFFAVEYQVRICSPNLAERSAPVRIAEIPDATRVVLVGKPDRTPQPGDILRFSSYVDAIKEQRACYCFRADSNRLLGGADPAHELRP